MFSPSNVFFSYVTQTTDGASVSFTSSSDLLLEIELGLFIICAPCVVTVLLVKQKWIRSTLRNFVIPSNSFIHSHI